MWLRAKNKAGLAVPWVFLRSYLARRWGVRPRDLDWEDEDVQAELAIMRLESAAEGER